MVYYGYNGQEIEDAEMDNMLRDRYEVIEKHPYFAYLGDAIAYAIQQLEKKHTPVSTFRIQEYLETLGISASYQDIVNRLDVS